MIPLFNTLLATLMVSVFLGGCGSKPNESGQSKEVQQVVIKGILLETLTMTSVPETMEAVGTVRSRTSGMVAARIPGTISMFTVREGDRVKKGQLLARLDAQENLSAAAFAVAGSDEARRGLDEAITRKKLADATFERYQKLFQEQAITRQEFDVKQAEKDLAIQGVARAEARLRQAQEGSRSAATMADYTRIIAPISGIITMKQADLGATVFPAQPLMTIEDESSYQLELAIPENLALKVKTGSPVQVTLDGVGAAFSAKISEIVPAADPASRTFMAKVSLNQKGLRSGMFGRGTIALGSSISGITVAKKALVERGALTSVWVVANDGIARMRIVKPGKQTGSRVEILSGLSDGERVVVDGAEKVSEGAKVE
jgi:RND family efflux transporter MFP subunit